MHKTELADQASLQIRARCIHAWMVDARREFGHAVPVAVDVRRDACTPPVMTMSDGGDGGVPGPAARSPCRDLWGGETPMQVRQKPELRRDSGVK